MSKLIEKLYAECALNQAPAYLERFFNTNADAEGKIRLPLHAAVGPAAFRRDLEKRVVVARDEIRTGTDMIPTIVLHWKPEGDDRPGKDQPGAAIRSAGPA